MVEPEKTIGGELRVDYLLHDAAGKPRIVVEAKCLGENLDKHGYVSKVLGYALGFKVQTVFITDGLQWHCYTNLHQGNTEATLFHLTQDNLLPGAIQLIQWLDAAQSGHYISSTPKLEMQAQVVSVAEAAIKLPAKKQVVKAVKQANDSLFVELAQLNPLHLQPGQKPKQLRLPDGSIRPLKTWKDILLEACEFVLKDRLDLQIPYPDKAGKKTFLFARQKPKAGISSTLVQYNGLPLFIHTNYSAKDCIVNALHILKLAATEKPVAAAVTF